MIEDKDLERLASRLGRDAHEHVDADRVATRVVARLREPVLRGDSWKRASWLALAAMVAGLVVGVGVFSRTPDPTTDRDQAELLVPLALEDLSTADLVDVLDSLTLEAPVHEVSARGFEDLNEAELRELLLMLEG